MRYTRSSRRQGGQTRVRPALLVASLCCAALPALAAGKVYYGSRACMTVTVRRVSGIGTDHARMEVEHTAADARAFCVEYSNDRSSKCVRDALADTHINDEFHGNCDTGRFVSIGGDALRFMGENRRRNKDGTDPRYIIRDEKGEVLDGSSASGYPVYLDQFKALCPGKVFGDD